MAGGGHVTRNHEEAGMEEHWGQNDEEERLGDRFGTWDWCRDG